MRASSLFLFCSTAPIISKDAAPNICIVADSMARRLDPRLRQIFRSYGHSSSSAKKSPLISHIVDGADFANLSHWEFRFQLYRLSQNWSHGLSQSSVRFGEPARDLRAGMEQRRSTLSSRSIL